MALPNRNAFALRPGMRRGLRTDIPIPTRLVSNEEFPPLGQTSEQVEVERRIREQAGRLAGRLGLRRRDFLKTSGGMAASLLAMNSVFGRFFDVLEVEAAEPAAFQERKGEPFSAEGEDLLPRLAVRKPLHYVLMDLEPEPGPVRRFEPSA